MPSRGPSCPPNTPGEDDVSSKNQPPLEGAATLGKSDQGREKIREDVIILEEVVENVVFSQTLIFTTMDSIVNFVRFVDFR